MKCYVYASGSSGNCMLLSSGGAKLMIDAGISFRRISGALSESGIAIQEIGGVLVTHEHSDHISGLKMLLKKTEVSVYAPATVAAQLAALLPEYASRICVLPVGARVDVGGVSVLAFHTPHDTLESVGYRIEGDGVFALATDMGHVTEEIRRGLIGADTVLIEANHDEQMLRTGPYPYPLKRRILSDHGHLSNEGCAALARELAESGTRTVILGHLSRENNIPGLALRTAEAAVAGTNCRVLCAPELGELQVEVEGCACSA